MAERLSRGEWRSAPHLELLSNKLSEIRKHPIFLIVSLPPRHGKSHLISKYTPVWFLDNWPWKKIILASYEGRFAAEWSGDAKDIIESSSEDLNIYLKRDNKSKSNWRLRHFNGGMVATGLQGPITGRGGDLVIIDDPIKGYKEALSSIVRDGQWHWYQSTLRPRLEPGGSIIVVLTRWHEDDLAGRLMNPEYQSESEYMDQWEVINIPATAHENDILGRELDEALWPERYDWKALKAIRSTMSSYWWQAMYQGSPRAEEGNIFKEADFKTYKALPKFKRVIQVWDTAFMDTKTAARSVCITMGEAVDGYYIIDLYYGRPEFPELTRRVKAEYAKWNPGRVKIEQKASGISLIQQLIRDTKVPIVKITGKVVADGKLVRAHSVSGFVEAGKVWIPDDAPWTSEFLDEVCGFPNATHDDIVDVLSYALLHFKASVFGGGGKKPQEPIGRKQSIWNQGNHGVISKSSWRRT
jgi:predicted phage terminase large subunit-like protein